ncbi:gephyrin-like molybdotransferase Glp [Alkalilacustris brevis]|uniref:molybdopterin molybdotransferase MoeA n=1 Tax=Alkalilacustris brevis TaxID=2026338 RepID=UPI000E0DEE25|nr:gephyrin-like molybdotransferase Glp [Alkalilacustris brevis]
MTSPPPLVDRADPLCCGCDSAGSDMLPLDEALVRGLALVPEPTGEAMLPLAVATGRVLARDVHSATALPVFDNAAMDGYALRLDDLRGPGPWCLPVRGRVRAGDTPPRLATGAAMRILTGAALPQGADTVIAQEDLRREGAMIVLQTLPRTGQNIRRAGEDMPQGACLLRRGRIIGPREAAAIAAAGQGQVAVRPRLRVALLCTGSELVPPGQPLAPGHIWDANRFLLGAALACPWIEQIDLGACPDDPAQLAGLLTSVSEQADMIVTTGGVSVGDEDHMARVIHEAGGSIHAMKIAMKPGKPMTLGRLGRALWVGLPGNPVAAFVTWHVIGMRLTEAMAGLAAPGLRKSVAALAAPVRHRPGRCEFRPARVLGHDSAGVTQVECLDAPGSHRIAQLAQADCLALIPAEAEGMRQGDLVEIMPL